MVSGGWGARASCGVDVLRGACKPLAGGGGCRRRWRSEREGLPGRMMQPSGGAGMRHPSLRMTEDDGRRSAEPEEEPPA